jgi:hypothetical protein
MNALILPAIFLLAMQRTVPSHKPVQTMTGTQQRSAPPGGTSSPLDHSFKIEEQATPQTTNGRTKTLVGNQEAPIVVGKVPDISIRKDWSDWATWSFGLLLVGTGAVQAVVLIRQTGLMKKQAELMERQTKIQEASMSQWVQFENWQSRDHENDLMLDISFQLVNPTIHTLTLKEGALEQDMAPRTNVISFIDAPLCLQINHLLSHSRFLSQSYG